MSNLINEHSVVVIQSTNKCSFVHPKRVELQVKIYTRLSKWKVTKSADDYLSGSTHVALWCNSSCRCA